MSCRRQGSLQLALAEFFEGRRLLKVSCTFDIAHPALTGASRDAKDMSV